MRVWRWMMKLMMLLPLIPTMLPPPPHQLLLLHLQVLTPSPMVPRTHCLIPPLQAELVRRTRMTAPPSPRPSSTDPVLGLLALHSLLLLPNQTQKLNLNLPPQLPAPASSPDRSVLAIRADLVLRRPSGRDHVSEWRPVRVSCRTCIHVLSKETAQNLNLDSESCLFANQHRAFTAHV